MKKFEIHYFENEKGERYYGIEYLEKEQPILTLEEQFMAELIYRLFSEGTLSMMSFMKKEGVLED